ncbi:hypothetical protein [Sphaerisporangium sp. NPDC051011]|uniref:hypothetical protein n=1 Tax=Sphaerisporangium sp. NPDC051011 TaxID=3155792 RepID=UPI0033C69262
MRLPTAFALGMAAFLAVSATAATAAQASPARLLGVSQTVCQSATTPTGWVQTAYFDWYTCGTPGSVFYNAKTIQDVTDTPSGGTVTACITPPPAGFYATAFSYSFSCEMTKTPNRIFNDQHTLTNLNGRPSGSTAIICGLQPSPPGWTTTAVVQAYQCVYPRSGGLGDNAIAIRKL